jgi:hypothetical protein
MLAEDTGEEHRLFAFSTRGPCADAGRPGMAGGELIATVTALRFFFKVMLDRPEWCIPVK